MLSLPFLSFLFSSLFNDVGDDANFLHISNDKDREGKTFPISMA